MILANAKRFCPGAPQAPLPSPAQSPKRWPMLVGLLFAIEECEDQPGALIATQSFGASTLIEFQARLLIGAGAGHIAVVVARLTPELIAAINRITRRGVAVDSVRSAGEARDKFHPLAQILVLADGLIASAESVALMATGGATDVMLITGDDAALPGMERVGREAIWAGVALASSARLGDVAALPGEYDVQSSLLRAMAQAGAALVPLPPGSGYEGHAIAWDAATLRLRSDQALAERVSRRSGWADRLIVAPLARLVLRQVTRRDNLEPLLIGLGGASVMLAPALGLLGLPGLGLLIALAAMVLLAAGSALAWLREQGTWARAQELAPVIGAALTALAIGSAAPAPDRPVTLLAAVVLVILGTLGERAGAQSQHWRASPAGLLVVVLPFVAVGLPLAGLLLAAGYAAVSLTAAVEALRRKP